MKKLHIAMAIAASLSTAAIAQAQDYQIEGGLGYATFDYDAGGDDSAIGLDATYYIETVKTADSVLNEAAFIGRNNNVGAGYATFDKAKFDALGLGVEWWFEDIYAAADMISADDDGQSNYFNTIQVGYMVQKNTLVAAVLETGDQDEDGMGLRAKYLGALGANTINLEASYVDTDGDAVTTYGGDFYFSNTLSAGLEFSDDDSKDELESTISVKNFFTPIISAELDYAMNYGGVKDDSAIEVRGAVRF